MKIILSTIEDSYAESHVLKKEWHDFASSFSFNRQKSFLGGRALLQESLSEFYGVDSLPQITTLSHGKPVFFESRYPFFNISHSSKLICLAIGDRELGLDVEYIKPRRNIEGLKNVETVEKETTNNLNSVKTIEEIKNANVEDRENVEIEIGGSQSITFTGTHLAEIQAILSIIPDNDDKNR